MPLTKQLINKSSGFISITLVALLPLLVAVIAVIAASYLVLRADSRTRHVCRTGLLQAQTEVQIHLKKLLGMNTEAQALRAKRTAAEVQLAASLGTPAAAEAAVELQEVEAAQLAFGALQKKELFEARMLSSSSPGRTLSAVQSEVSGAALVNRGSRMRARGHVQSAKFDVIATPPDSPTPDYQPSLRFRDRQVMTVSWEFDLRDFLPAWTRPFVDIADLSGKAGCSTTLEKENEDWRPQITEAKSSSNYY